MWRSMRQRWVGVVALVLAVGANAGQGWPKAVPETAGSPDDTVVFAVVGDNRPSGGSDAPANSPAKGKGGGRGAAH